MFGYGSGMTKYNQHYSLIAYVKHNIVVNGVDMDIYVISIKRMNDDNIWFRLAQTTPGKPQWTHLYVNVPRDVLRCGH